MSGISNGAPGAVARLMSGARWVDFDTGSGFLAAVSSPPPEPAPYKVDVDDWRLRHPGLAPGPGPHAAGSFGFWYREPGRTRASYSPPAAGEPTTARKERAET